MATADITAETRQVFIDRLCPVQFLTGVRKLLRFFPVNFISNTNRYFFHIGKNIQLCQSEISAALHLNSITGSNCVKRADSSWPSGGCAIFPSGFPQQIPFFPKHFTDKWPFSYAGRIGFHYPDCFIQANKGDSCSKGRISSERRRSGCIWIDAIIDITQRPELRLKEDGFPFSDCLSQIIG